MNESELSSKSYEQCANIVEAVPVILQLIVFRIIETQNRVSLIVLLI
jgi:hypothetical protein